MDEREDYDDEALYGLHEHRDPVRRDDEPTGPVGHFDQHREPPPRRCDCGRELGWTWWEGNARNRIRPRWTAPPVSPCVVCAPVREAEQAAKVLARRQHEAGIPVVHRDHRWEHVVRMERGESWGAFIRRTRATQPKAIGVSVQSAPAARALRDWSPAVGSMYVHGPVGSGKSLMVAATCTALLGSLSDRREVEMTDEELLQRWGQDGYDGAVSLHRHIRIDPGGQARQVLYIDEETLFQRVADGWNKDKDPLAKIAEHPCLVLDDLGTVGALGGKVRDLVDRMVRRLVAYRYDRRLPMLVTSNAPMSELERHYDRRTVSRLAEMVGAHEHALEGLPEALVKAGYDWRRPPPEDGRRAA